MRTTTKSVPDVESRDGGAPALTVEVSVEIVSAFFESAAAVVGVVGELGAKHVYLDPRDATPDASARSYCALCLRYGLGVLAIDHASSCLIGKAIAAVGKFKADVEVLARAIAGAELAALGAGSPDAQPAPASPRSSGLRVEYLVENPRHRFNPYSDPCTSWLKGMACELERGHFGAHCSDGHVWADDSRRLA